MSERPNHTTAIRAQMAEETEFITGRTGEKNSPSRFEEPSRMPSGTPITAAIMNPTVIR